MPFDDIIIVTKKNNMQERHAVSDMFGYAARQGWLKGEQEGAKR